MNNLKIGIVGVAAVAILLSIGAYFQARMREKDEALAQQADRIAQLEGENERLSNVIANTKNSAPQPSEPSQELLRLRGQVGVLRQETKELGGLRNENVRLSEALAESVTNQVSPADHLVVRQNHAVDAMTTLLRAVKAYAANHNGQYPPNLDHLVATGDLKATELAGNLRPSDFEFVPDLGMDAGGRQTILRLRVPIAKPGGGGLVVVGGVTDAGVPFTSVWNVAP